MTDKNTDIKPRRPDDDSTALAVPGFGFPSFFEEFTRPFDELMGQMFPESMKSFFAEARGREPSIDFQDRGDHYLVTAELPGFDKDDVEVRIDSNSLELQGEKRSARETKDKQGSQTMSSRSYFQRYMALPDEVLSEKVTGSMKNGVLELKLPKRVPKASGKSRRVDLK